VNLQKENQQSGPIGNLTEEVQAASKEEVPKVLKGEAPEVQKDDPTAVQKTRAPDIKEKANSEKKIRRNTVDNCQIPYLIWQPPKSPIWGTLSQKFQTL